MAHAIGDHATGFAGGRDHGATGAHAKAVDRATVGRVVHQLVISRAQHGMPGMHAPACFVDHTLRMLDAHAYGKRFGSHRDTVSVQHGEAVARAVPERHHHVLRVQGVTLAAVLLQYVQRLHLLLCALLFMRNVNHALVEPHLATEPDDVLAQTFNHLDQFEGTYVRMRCPQYFFGRAEIHKLLHHLATQMARVLDLAVELAVGKRARAAFAELHIALGFEHRLAP